MAKDVKVYHVLTALEQIEKWTHEVRRVLQSLPADQVLTAAPLTVAPEALVPRPLGDGCQGGGPE